MHKILTFDCEADWLAWRAEGIGASDVPSIMGEGFSTPYELWKQKMGITEKRTSEAMNLGKKHEADAVAALEMLMFDRKGIFDQQVAMQSDEHPFLRCTLDGRHVDTNTICEVKSIKGAAKKIHRVIPKKYYGQVQMQLFISGAMQCVYAEYDIDEKTIWRDVVSSNRAYQKKMIRACEAFWHCMKNETPPKLTQKEWAESSSEGGRVPAQWGELEEQYKKAKEMVRWAKQNLDAVEEEMIKMVDERPAIGSEHELRVSFYEGAIDYEAIRELRGIDLSQYRKPPTKRYSIVSIK